MKRILASILAVLAIACIAAFKLPGSTNSLLQQSVLAQDTSVAISIPEDAEVRFRNDSVTRSGRVINLNSRQITLQRSSNTTSIPLENIERIVYDRNSPFYRSSGEIVIRGGQALPVGEQDVWNSIPLGSFSFVQGSTRQARVALDSAIPPAKLRGIIAVASKSTYVVDEMSFNLEQNSLNLAVTPY